ncbi:MAG: J domain-containing protein [Anaerolineae bacterium]|nr:J domain-containing protein [Anaerolineae bacterium]
MVPYCQRILKINLSFDQTMRLVRMALENTKTQLEQEEAGGRRGVILASKGFSFWSWGEKIMILVEANGFQTIVRLVSKSAKAKTRRDWGKNRRNLNSLESCMQRLVREQGSNFLPGSFEEDTPYKVLDVSPQSTREELIEAYRQKVRLYHPDLMVGLAPELRQLAEDRMKAINAAYRHVLTQNKKES